tara:strand:- start:46 stop:231 length:186 start_codon:yes stop_codon:yes gene_type:complete
MNYVSKKNYFNLLGNLARIKAKVFVKSRSDDNKKIKIKFIGKINLKFTPFFFGSIIPLIKI